MAQYVGGSWATVGVVTNPSNVGTTYAFDLSPSAVQLRFTWNKVYSNIALDDVIVTGAPYEGEIDSDGDGMSDDYESVFFSGATNAVPWADDDGDGRSNYDEFIAGTNPKTNSSVLALAPYATNQTATANLVFRWPSVSGRVYSIWRATNVAGPYTQHIGNLSATVPTNSVTNAVPAELGSISTASACSARLDPRQSRSGGPHGLAPWGANFPSHGTRPWGSYPATRAAARTARRRKQSAGRARDSASVATSGTMARAAKWLEPPATPSGEDRGTTLKSAPPSKGTACRRAPPSPRRTPCLCPSAIVRPARLRR